MRHYWSTCPHMHPEITCGDAMPPDAAPILNSWASDFDLYLTLDWTYPGAVPYDSIEFEVALDGGGTWTACGSSTSNPYQIDSGDFAEVTSIINGISQGAFRCRAVNGAGAGPWSNTIYTQPIACSGVAISQFGANFGLVWTHPGQIGAAWLDGTVGYNVDKRVNGGAWLNIGHGFGPLESDNGAADPHDGGSASDTVQIRIRAEGIDGQHGDFTESNILNLDPW